MELPYDPAIPLLGIYPEKTLIQKDTCSPMFIAVLFAVMDRTEVQLRGTTPRPRSEAAVERSNSTSKEQRLWGHNRVEKSYSTFKVRRADLVHGKEQWLHFAGAAVKKYSISKVRETQVRW